MVDHLNDIQHIVVLMLENRSFDHMLGFLYADQQPKRFVGAGYPLKFEGLTGKETNDCDSDPVAPVFQAKPLYCLPGGNPSEGYNATCWQLAGHGPPLTPDDDTAAKQGQRNKHFLKDFALQLERDRKSPDQKHPLLPGTLPADILGIFTPKQLPVLSTLAREYAVCDYWFSSVPTMTWPNRAFACAGTSQGQMSDEKDSIHQRFYIEVPKTPREPRVVSIFGMLQAKGKNWAIYYGGGACQAQLMFQDVADNPTKILPLGEVNPKDPAKLAWHLADDVQNKRLPSYAFIEPHFGIHGNDQHPNYNVDKGEQLIKAVYDALRSNLEEWRKTLFIITYDEHGGCYDHVWPPADAVYEPYDGYSDQTHHFDFGRLGVRVPTVLVSPLIEAGTVCRPKQNRHFDHASILSTVEERWNLPNLTARDGTASDVGHVLTLDLAHARTDNPLQNVIAPVAPDCHPGATGLSHLQQVHAEYVAQLPIPDRLGRTQHVMPELHTEEEYIEYVQSRTAEWEASQRSTTP